MEKTFSGQMNKRIDNLTTCTTLSVKFILAKRIESKHFQKYSQCLSKQRCPVL